MKWFCPNCEVQMAATKGDDDWIVLCTMCGLGMKVVIMQEPTKNYDQVTEDFNKIPLTDSQRGTKRFSSSKLKIA